MVECRSLSRRARHPRRNDHAWNQTAGGGGDRGGGLVIGAGQTGAPLAEILDNRGYAVRVLVRDPAKVDGLPKAATLVAADATKPETLAPAFAGVDYVVSTIGAGTPTGPNNPEAVDYKGVANLADAAKSAGVKQFVLMSSIGAGIEDPDFPLNKGFGMVLKWKGRGEAHLRQSGVPYTIVRPGGLLNEDGGKPCKAGAVGIALFPGKEMRPTPPETRICRAEVALVMESALNNPDAVGKTVSMLKDGAGQPETWRGVWASLPKD